MTATKKTESPIDDHDAPSEKAPDGATKNNPKTETSKDAKEKPKAELKVSKDNVLQAAKDASVIGNYDTAIEVAEEYLKQDDAPDKHFVQEHLDIIKKRAGV